MCGYVAWSSSGTPGRGNRRELLAEGLSLSLLPALETLPCCWVALFSLNRRGGALVLLPFDIPLLADIHGRAAFV